MTMFSNRDFDQHEKVLFGYDPATGLKAIIAVHNSHLGPALGGCRMYPYASDSAALSDVLRLARGMTYKSALAKLPLGGGKSVIIGDPSRDKTPALLHAMGRLVESLSGLYIVAQDSGTSVQDMREIASVTRYVAGAENVLDRDGNAHSGDPSPATAFGVFTGIKRAVRHRLQREDLAGIRVAIQGLGNVGFALARHLHNAGAHLLVSDVNERNVARAVEQFGAQAVANEAICAQSVDVFSPCALGGAINARTIDLLRAPIVAGAANNQLALPEYEQLLHQRGVLYVPDFVINAGGIIHVYYMREHRPWEEAALHVEEIGATLDEIFSRCARTGDTPSAVAKQLAEERFRPQSVSATPVPERETGWV